MRKKDKEGTKVEENGKKWKNERKIKNEWKEEEERNIWGRDTKKNEQWKGELNNIEQKSEKKTINTIRKLKWLRNNFKGGGQCATEEKKKNERTKEVKSYGGC